MESQGKVFIKVMVITWEYYRAVRVRRVRSEWDGKLRERRRERFSALPLLMVIFSCLSF